MDVKQAGERLASVYRANGIKGTARRAVRKVRSLSAGVSFDEVDVIRQSLIARQDGGLMVDVGAQRGNTLVGFLDAGWDVIAFEPDPINLVELKVRHGNRQGLAILELALSDELRDNVDFYGSNRSTGISGLLHFDESHEVVASVEVSTLDVVLRDRGISSIDFLKIDTEGHDLAVLRGADLEALAPAIIVAEFDQFKANHGGHSLGEIEEYLQAAGYETFVSEWHPIDSYGGTHRWHRVCKAADDLADDLAWGNIIGVRSAENAQQLMQAIEIAGVNGS